MIKDHQTDRRLRTEEIPADLVIVGGGLAGSCCAITAAREGLAVVLFQDRPVLGGNASSEVRLWALGATSHMGNNNRWAREGGVIDEVLVENLWRNREGNPVIFDSVVMEKVTAEPNIRLLLNTSVHEVLKGGDGRVEAVRGFCSQNSTMYEARAPLFCDASGDGVVGFLAGAAFRMGAEPREEFGEGFAPGGDFGELLGHSLFFYTKDAGRPVRYVAPAYALKDVSAIRKHRRFGLKDQGCNFWWIEYGGRLDTVHDSEAIKWELWRVVYGVWDHIKNSGEFPEAETMTLEWVGMIPGKRESRRFEGDVILTQQDIVDQRTWADAVSYGGWALDLHPADGVYSAESPCVQWHSKGVYQIPWRAMYSRNVPNLFLAGRIISVSHVAFGSTRVMLTCAHGAQAVGVAAGFCRRLGIDPAQAAAAETMREIQKRLLRLGQHIPGVSIADEADLAQSARIEATSSLQLAGLPGDGGLLRLENPWAMILPAQPGRFPAVAFRATASAPTTLEAELRASSRRGNFTPDVVLGRASVALQPGTESSAAFEFNAEVAEDQYVFVCLLANPLVSVRCSSRRVTGILSATHEVNGRVAKAAVQDPPAGTGIDRFEFWLPRRRPDGRNLAFELSQPLDAFRPGSVANGATRPTTSANAWVASPDDAQPVLSLEWDRPRSIATIELTFDPDWDHPLESVLMGHPEDASPFCVKAYQIEDADGRVLHACADNHQARNVIRLERPVETASLRIRILEAREAPAAVFEVRCYS